jgi:hypothetical protein
MAMAQHHEPPPKMDRFRDTRKIEVVGPLVRWLYPDHDSRSPNPFAAVCIDQVNLQSWLGWGGTKLHKSADSGNLTKTQKYINVEEGF